MSLNSQGRMWKATTFHTEWKTKTKKWQRRKRQCALRWRRWRHFQTKRRQWLFFVSINTRVNFSAIERRHKSEFRRPLSCMSCIYFERIGTCGWARTKPRGGLSPVNLHLHLGIEYSSRPKIDHSIWVLEAMIDSLALGSPPHPDLSMCPDPRAIIQLEHDD